MLRIAFKQDGDSGEWFASLVGYGAGYGSPPGYMDKKTSSNSEIVLSTIL